MGMIYTANLVGFSFANNGAVDLWEITAPTDAVVVLHSVYIGQDSDYADAQAEGLTVSLTRYATAGVNGTALTPAPHDTGYAAAGSTVDKLNTTQGGTPTVVLSDSWNIQIGWQYRPSPEERIVISPGKILAVELPDSPADTIVIDSSITFEEIGG